MPRSLLASRWVRRLAASLGVALLAAAGIAALRARHGAERLWREAEGLFERGEHRGALGRYLALADAHPGDPLALKALHQAATIDRLFLRDEREAVAALRELARRDPAGEWGRRAQRQLGEIFEQRDGGCRQAIVEYQRFIGMDPGGAGNDEAQLAVARCSFALGDYEQARAEHELLLERYPESGLRPRALLGIAGALYVTGRHAPAAAAYRRVSAETDDPELRAEAAFGAAGALEAAGDLAAALRELEQARAGHPNPALVEQRLARVRDRMGQQAGR